MMKGGMGNKYLEDSSQIQSPRNESNKLVATTPIDTSKVIHLEKTPPKDPSQTNNQLESGVGIKEA